MTTGWINLISSSRPSSWCLVSLLIFHSHKRAADNLSSVQPPFNPSESASNIILSGKARVMIAGGFDNNSEERFYKFVNMKATRNTETGLSCSAVFNQVELIDDICTIAGQILTGMLDITEFLTTSLLKPTTLSFGDWFLLSKPLKSLVL